MPPPKQTTPISTLSISRSTGVFHSVSVSTFRSKPSTQCALPTLSAQHNPLKISGTSSSRPNRHKLWYYNPRSTGATLPNMICMGLVRFRSTACWLLWDVEPSMPVIISKLLVSMTSISVLILHATSFDCVITLYTRIFLHVPIDPY